MNIKQILRDKDIESLNHIKRWCLNRTIRDENIAEHSYWVTMISSMLTEELIVSDNLNTVRFKLQVLQIATFHDFDEMFTSDIPHQVKNNPHNGKEIRKAVDSFAKFRLEKKFSDKSRSSEMIIGSTLNKNEEAYSIVKVADWLSFMKYAYTEITLGNSDFLPIMGICQEGLKKQIIKSQTVLTNMITDITFNYEVYQEIENTNFLEL